MSIEYPFMAANEKLEEALGWLTQARHPENDQEQTMDCLEQVHGYLGEALNALEDAAFERDVDDNGIMHSTVIDPVAEDAFNKLTALIGDVLASEFFEIQGKFNHYLEQRLKGFIPKEYKERLEAERNDWKKMEDAMPW